MNRGNILDFVEFQNRVKPRWIEMTARDGTPLRFRVSNLSYDFDLEKLRMTPEMAKELDRQKRELGIEDVQEFDEVTGEPI